MNVRSMGPFSEIEELILLSFLAWAATNVSARRDLVTYLWKRCAHSRLESYSMQLYLRQIWYDPRLRFNRDLWDRTFFSLNWMFVDRLWKPDTFFINGKKSNFHKITSPNMFIRLRYDGQITWSMRLTVRATCLMHLRKFPLDTQHCPLKMASYGYTAKDILYEWDPNKLVMVNDDVSLAQYELVNISTHTERVTIRHTEEISTLMVKFHLSRRTGFFLLQVYVPCILIVCCSWVAFWITKKDVPGRVGLGVTTVLAMTTLGFGGLANGPPVSYPTALDYFVIVCFAFVFGSVMEFAFINFTERATTKRRKKMEELRKQIVERITAASKGGTMMVTTKIEEGKPILKDTLRHVLKVPLTVLPLADEVASPTQEPETGDTQEGIKDLMKLSLTAVPDSSEVLKTEDTSASGPTSSQKEEPEGIRSGPSSPLIKSRFKMMKLGKTDKSRSEEEKRAETSEKTSSPTPSIIVDVTEEDDSPSPTPKTVTIFELLLQKKKLMANMKPNLVIPSEEDILERFSIIDIYSRRIFPSLFFVATSLYWILFNYYITDEFPDDRLPPSDGLIVTSG